MEDIIIVIKKISKTKLKQLAEKRFGDLIKAVVDVKRGIMALGGELHADEEAELLKNGSEDIENQEIKEKIKNIIKNLTE